MIIAQLTGDLGSQMFQYALGRRLSIIHQTALKLDIAPLEVSPHCYALDRFRIHASVAEKQDVSQLVNLHLLRHASQSVSPQNFTARTSMEEGSSISALRDNTYLVGDCWILRYFSAIHKNLQDELKVKTPPTGRNKKYLRQITKENAVALHLYRNTSATGIYPLSIEYYERAVEAIAARLKKPVFYLFSDDPIWCKTNFSLKYPHHLIDHNDHINQFEDFRLMSNCRHHIISNTATSWWAAWLAPNKKKIVIAPRAWFSDGQSSDDLLPQNWVQIENETPLN